MRPVSMILSLLFLFIASIAGAKTLDGSDRSDRLVVYVGVMPAAVARDAIADHVGPSNGHGTAAPSSSSPFHQNTDMKPRLFPPDFVASPCRTASATAGPRLA